MIYRIPACESVKGRKLNAKAPGTPRGGKRVREKASPGRFTGILLMAA
jgi:hypothetical protein